MATLVRERPPAPLVDVSDDAGEAAAPDALRAAVPTPFSREEHARLARDTEHALPAELAHTPRAVPAELAPLLQPQEATDERRVRAPLVLPTPR
jgi:hypothetical protein